MAEKILMLAVGALIPSIGYLIKRIIERRSKLETFDRHMKLLEINKEMTSQKVTVEDLRFLEAALEGRPGAVATQVKLIEGQITSTIGDSTEAPITQAEINTIASDGFERAREKMAGILKELSSRLDGKERVALLNAQMTWESYCYDQAESASIGYSGGSIYSTIFFSEMESLTLDRAARLQFELDQLDAQSRNHA